MWFEFSAFGFISLFVSANAILVGIALLVRDQKRQAQVKTRFALVLICIGYLLATFTLIYYEVIIYEGFFRISHDLAALLFGACILDYVRCSINLNSLKVAYIAPAAIYLLAWFSFGETFYSRIDIVHLDAIGFAFSVLALLTYLRTLRQQSLAGEIVDRKLNVELVLTTILIIYLIQFMYLINDENSSLFIAPPLLGAICIGLFFGVFIFSPKGTNFFVASNILRTSRVTPGSFESISSAVASQELYLDSSLSVDTLAKTLGYKARDLSEIVNSESGGSFYEFINGFRVEKAKSLLDSEKENRTSIEAIALICGFKSRSSFYEYFRKVTGKSPGDYRNQQQ